MDTGACCVAPSAPQRSDDQIVPAHPGDCWNSHQTNHQQPFLDAWLQMQIVKLLLIIEKLTKSAIEINNSSKLKPKVHLNMKRLDKWEPAEKVLVSF
ncbi:hypothetical protein QE152_g11407 [Popillia japonica]|uniref:Uncharacterized protein n=1 Tax=Popillia japonica TaxID=7064 RepID=A0AAW1LSE6_POPJA